ncbi:MAG TPA: NlpC/P60 family protein [Catenuloplanes sp.]
MLLTGLAFSLIGSAAPAQAEPSVTEIQKKIDKASDELEKVVESYNKNREDLKATQAASTALTTRMQPLEEQLAASGAQVAEIAVTAYKTGQVGAASALLTGTASGSLVERLGMLDKIARERQSRVATFTESSERYRGEKQKLDTTQARQAALAKELETRKKKIEADLKKLYELRTQAYGRATQASPGGYTGKVPAVSGNAGAAVRFAYGAIGKPYVWGAEGPGGYDCSGLTLSAWRAAGKSLPHNAAMQWNAVSHISRSEVRAGDLVFYNGLSHVAIAVSGSRMIHAPTFGQNVHEASIDVMTPYGYGRVR